MELLTILAVVIGLMVLAAGWFVLSIHLAFLAGDFGARRSPQMKWFCYLSVAYSMIASGFVIFAYTMAKLTGEI